jgi:signal transduction histidine kinase
VQQLEAGVEAQSRLINDLLDVSRIASGKLELERQEVDVGQIAAEVVEEFRPAADRARIQLDLRRPRAAAVVDGDAGRLKQVVRNLIDNAIKFTSAGGRVDVALELEPSQVSLCVRDSGAGLAPDHLALIFDQFWQADDRTTRRSGGLGLGLNIVKHIVERHGGSVRASSDGIGCGAEFSICLPLVAQARGAVSPAPAPAPEPGVAAGGDVLVVDDEPDAAEALTLALRMRGLSVRVAFDG